MWEDAAFLKDAWALGSCLTNTLRFIQERRRGPDHHLLGAHRLTAALVNFGPTSRLSVISCGFMPLVIVVMMMMVKTMMCSPIPSPGTLGKPGKTPLTTTLPGTLLHRGHLPRIEANVWASVVCLACQSATLPSCQDEPEGLAESSRCLLPHFVIHASAQVPLPLGFRPIQLRSRLRLLAQLRSSPCSGERARQLTTKPRDAMRPPGPPGRRPPCCFILTASCASSLVSALHRLPGIEENHPVGCNRRSRFVTVLHAMAPGPAMSCRLQCARPHERITGHGPKEVWQSQAAEFVFLLLA